MARYTAPMHARLCGLVAALVLPLVTLAPPVTAAEGLQVSRHDDAWLVSGRLDNAALVPVLASLAEQAGFTLHLSSRLPHREVTLDAHSRALPQTLAALLSGTEHIVEVDAAGKVRAVYLFAVGEETPTAARADKLPPDGAIATLPEGSASSAMQAALAATAQAPSGEAVAAVFAQREAIFDAFVERYGAALPPHLIEQARGKAHGESQP